VKLTLAGRHVAGLKLWALGLDGRQVEQIKTTSDGSSLAISLDTGDLTAVTPSF